MKIKEIYKRGMLSNIKDLDKKALNNNLSLDSLSLSFSKGEYKVYTGRLAFETDWFIIKRDNEIIGIFYVYDLEQLWLDKFGFVRARGHETELTIDLDGMEYESIFTR